jgi:hypothetical protein
MTTQRNTTALVTGSAHLQSYDDEKKDDSHGRSVEQLQLVFHVGADRWEDTVHQCACHKLVVISLVVTTHNRNVMPGFIWIILKIYDEMNWGLNK